MFKGIDKAMTVLILGQICVNLGLVVVVIYAVKRFLKGVRVYSSDE